MMNCPACQNLMTHGQLWLDQTWLGTLLVGSGMPHVMFTGDQRSMTVFDWSDNDCVADRCEKCGLIMFQGRPDVTGT